jgi:ubiquinone/menaquinone biosynthesis C-methylase UbiE
MFPVLRNQRRTIIFYGFVSIIYDRLNPHIYTHRMKKMLISEIEGEKILDVGVGTGYTSKDLKNAVGIDISQRMLSRARDYGGSLILADALYPPFKSESFDTIICAGSLYYLPEPVEGLKILHSLLKPRGVVLYLGPNIKLLKFWVRAYSGAELEELFGLAGFKVEKVMKVGFRGIAYFAKARRLK